MSSLFANLTDFVGCSYVAHPYFVAQSNPAMVMSLPVSIMVFWNLEIGPRMFKTKSSHQTSAVSEYASVWLRLSSSCRVRRSTNCSQMTKQSLIRAWLGNFVDFFVDSFGVHVEPNRPCISLWCFVYAWPKI